MRAAGVTVVLAVVAWSVPWRLGMLSAPSITGAPLGVVAPLAALILGLLATLLLEYDWHYRRAPLRLMDELERRVAALEQTRAVRPIARLQFDFNVKTQQARLHVTNDGGEGEFWVPLLIDGGLSGRVEHAVFATWEHTDRVKTSVASGQTRTLCLAQLDLSAFPFAQWQVYVTREDGPPSALRAMHTSVIGGAPDAHAPTMFLKVSILSTPDPGEGVRICTIALNPFDAQRLHS